MVSMKPISQRPSTLADTAYERISQALLDGSIEPESRLVMDDLAEQLQISRTPVRDALLRLEREGLVEPTGRRGYVVRQLDAGASAHLYEARKAVECYAASIAAGLGADAREYIAKVIESTAHTDLSDVKAVYEANLLVHRSFVEVVDNPVLLDLFDTVWQGARGQVMFADYLAHERSDVSIAEAHAPLLEALEKGSDDAYAAMSAHISAGLSVHHR